MRRWRHECPAITDAFASRERSESTDRETYVTDLLAWSQLILSRLPDRQREAIRLHALEGQPYRDVAAAMHASVGAVRFNVHAALRRLREKWPKPTPPMPPI